MKNKYINLSIIILTLLYTTNCDLTSRITVSNNSNIKVYLFSSNNLNSMEIPYFNGSYIDENSVGGYTLVNETVDDYFTQNSIIQLFVVKFFPSEKYDEVMKNKSYIILGKTILTKQKLDSLGGKLSFPKDFELVE